VLDAVALWARHPDEIEADLAGHYNINIADWHQGSRDECGALRLSSRRMLNLVHSLPESSRFKACAPEPFGRDGDWTLMQRVAVDTNELLAKYVASHFGGKYSTFLSPKQQRERHREAVAMDQHVRTTSQSLARAMSPPIRQGDS
jgi:hypothetical protein